MAYAGVISLKQTIHRLLNTSHFGIASSSREIVEFAYEEVTSLQQALERLADSSSSSSKRLNDLDAQIRDAVHQLEDLLELQEANQFPSEYESHKDLDLEEVRQDISSLVERLKKMDEEYNKMLDNPLPEEQEEDDGDDDAAAVSSTIGFGVEMVGLSHEFFEIKHDVLVITRPNEFGVFPIIGVPGTGRTILAKMVFEDLCINGQGNYFDCGAWVTIGPKYHFNEILLSIISQIDDRAGNDEFFNSEAGVDSYLCAILKGRRYMIVLDDVTDTRIWGHLRGTFPVQHNGSLVLLTTRHKEVAIHARCFFHLYCRPMPDDSTGDMLRLLTVGKNEPWPPELEEAGQKIAENCQGLRIILAKVLVLLWETESPECWEKIAADEENSIFKLVDDDEILEMCKIKEDIQQLFNSLAKQTDETDLSSEPATEAVDSSSLNIEALLGLPGEVEFIKTKLFPKRLFGTMEVISFVGMPGIGKTTFVKRIFEDLDISGRFKHCAWVTLGPKYQSKEILVDILAQIYPDISKMHMKEDSKLAKDLCAKLFNKRCLIVLDDVWDEKPLLYLEKLFPDIMGKALVTTRLANVARFEKHNTVHKMRLLNKEESWCLFRQKVFAEEFYSHELEKAGKRISDYCEGLPLLILTVADILSKAEKTAEYWNKVADKKNSVIVDAHNAISKVLFPSYESLPQHLKVCFLYMGVFLESYEIPRSKLINLWIGEGFLEPNLSQNVEDFAAECLSELVDRSLFMVRAKGSNFDTKTCGLHPVFWHLSNNELVKTKFSYSWNSYDDNSIEDVNSHRRLSIHNSILLGIKDVNNSMTSISNTRSLLCTGPPLQYQVPIHLNLRLLRVLEALTIRFYEFPIEVVKLFHLRYLALTCNGKIPASISKLRKLQFLIVIRHLNIKFYGDLSYLPMEIWDMKELKHLQITGSNLPNPKCGAVLPNLLTLLDVSTQSCTKRVLKRIPNLKKLGIRIELAPDDNCYPFRCLNRISRIRRLESLKCVVVNPELRSDVVAPPAPRSMFPSGLKKLSLSGLGYPWEYMSTIGSLPNLEVLKLRCYAFRGPTWEIGDGTFRRVKFLLIEDTDLVNWSCTFLSFGVLNHLSIKHCYKLEKFPISVQFSLETIEVIDCNPSAVMWAKQADENNLNSPIRMDSFLTAHIHSSWVAGEAQVKTSSKVQKMLSLLDMQDENSST